ncbi:sigma factor-like helix-turn-helix DNA-binding protein [Streptomyces erythrochromogenes]|uniref:sigma factor-like helix-turn-helix DNA-binding protein n=1 Tax=Streptomyces erythrochromogenes TaxID=285574 RepID=UPI00386ED905|nr:hypothetical protein OG489_38475 [Streptomyces erythrochromogenes]
MAVLVVLETLSPLERAVFVLHEVFGFAHTEIGSILGRSSAAVRRLATRATGPYRICTRGSPPCSPRWRGACARRGRPSATGGWPATRGRWSSPVPVRSPR